VDELIQAINDKNKEIERLKQELENTEKALAIKERENYILRNDIKSKYPYFFAVRLEENKGLWYNLHYVGKDNYFDESPIRYRDLKERMFNDLHELLKDLDKQMENEQ